MLRSHVSCSGYPVRLVRERTLERHPLLEQGGHLIEEKRCRARQAEASRFGVRNCAAAVNAREAMIAFPKNEKPADTAGLRQTLPLQENLERAKGLEPSTPTLARPR